MLAIDGANALHNPNCIGDKGGLFTTISPRFSNTMIGKGVIPSGLGVWNFFKHPTLGFGGILNVYAPNTLAGHIALWTELMHTYIGFYNFLASFRQLQHGGEGKRSTWRITT